MGSFLFRRATRLLEAMKRWFVAQEWNLADADRALCMTRVSKRRQTFFEYAALCSFICIELVLPYLLNLITHDSNDSRRNKYVYVNYSRREKRSETS